MNRSALRCALVFAMMSIPLGLAACHMDRGDHHRGDRDHGERHDPDHHDEPHS